MLYDYKFNLYFLKACAEGENILCFLENLFYFLKK